MTTRDALNLGAAESGFDDGGIHNRGMMQSAARAFLLRVVSGYCFSCRREDFIAVSFLCELR